MDKKAENIVVPPKKDINKDTIIDDSNRFIDIKRYYIENYQNI